MSKTRTRLPYSVDITAEPEIYQDTGPFVDLLKKYQGEKWDESFGPFRPGQKTAVKVTEAITFKTPENRRKFISAIKKRYGRKVTIRPYNLEC